MCGSFLDIFIQQVSGKIPALLQVFVLIKNVSIPGTDTAYLLGGAIATSAMQVTEG